MDTKNTKKHKVCIAMAISNITSAPSPHPTIRGQGAVIHSVATPREIRMHYGVQSATFVRTVFPGQASGTYQLNHMITEPAGRTVIRPGTRQPARAAGSPPIPYPPPNASAYYSNQYTRIIPNTSKRVYG